MDSLLQHGAVCSNRAGADESGPLDMAALTKSMVKGDDAAYRTFYDAYFDRLSRYLLVVTRGDEDSAREAIQAALLRVVRYIRVFQCESTFWSWLTVLARSALADQTRKRRRYLGFLDRFIQNTQSVTIPPRPDADDAELFFLLEKNLALLCDGERDLLQRKYFKGESVREIAAELQTSEKSVESRLVRIRRKLKEALLDSLRNE